MSIGVSFSSTMDWPSVQGVFQPRPETLGLAPASLRTYIGQAVRKLDCMNKDISTLVEIMINFWSPWAQAQNKMSS